MKVTWHSKQIMAYQTIGFCEYRSKLGEVGSYTARIKDLPERGRRLYHMVQNIISNIFSQSHGRARLILSSPLWTPNYHTATPYDKWCFLSHIGMHGWYGESPMGSQLPHRHPMWQVSFPASFYSSFTVVKLFTIFIPTRYRLPPDSIKTPSVTDTELFRNPGIG